MVALQNTNMHWHIPIEDKNTYFRKYLGLIDDTVKKDFQKIEDFEKDVKNGKIEYAVDPSGHEWDPSDYIGDMVWEANEIEQLMLRSFVIGVFVFMEARITQLCEFTYRRKKSVFSYTDLKGSGIERSIKYIESTLNIKFPEDSSLMEDFKVAKVIRNSLVHKEGKIETGDIKLIDTYIKKNHNLLSLDVSNTVQITNEYALSLIELNSKICSEVEKHHKYDDDEDPFCR